MYCAARTILDFTRQNKKFRKKLQKGEDNGFNFSSLRLGVQKVFFQDMRPFPPISQPLSCQGGLTKAVNTCKQTRMKTDLSLAKIYTKKYDSRYLDRLVEHGRIHTCLYNVQYLCPPHFNVFVCFKALDKFLVLFLTSLINIT